MMLLSMSTWLSCDEMNENECDADEYDLFGIQKYKVICARSLRMPPGLEALKHDVNAVSSNGLKMLSNGSLVALPMSGFWWILAQTSPFFCNDWSNGMI